MKIEVENVEFKNFLSFGSNTQKVDLMKGVNIVLGKDIDRDKSNGAGKSSFLETIPFALFGQVQRNIRKEQIINWRNKKGCEVICNFKINGNSYSILRAIKPDNFEIYKNNTLIDKPSHVREYQQQLDEILGINYQTFMSLIHSNINSSQKILAMSKPDKRKFLERVFNLGIYSHIYERAVSKIRNMEEKIRFIDVEIQQKQWAVKESNDRIIKLNNELENIDKSKNKIKEEIETQKEICENRDEVYKKLSNAEKSVVNYEETVRKFENDIQRDLDKIKYIRFEKISPISKDIDLIEKEKQANEKTEKYKKELESFVEKWGNIDKIKDTEEHCDNRLIELQKNEKKLNVLINKKKEDIGENKNEIKNNKRIIIRFKDGKCPTCGQSVKEEKVMVKAKEDYKNAIINGEKLEKELGKIGSKLSNIEVEINKTRKERSHIKEIKEEYHRLRELGGKQIKMTGGDEEKKKLVEEKIKFGKELEKLEEKVDNTEKEFEKWDNELKQAKREVKDISEDIIRLEKAESILDRLRDRMRSEDESKNGIYKLINDEKITIEKNEKIISVKNKEKNKTGSIIEYLEYVKEICKDENIKQYAISSLMPYLNQQMNHYLSEVGYGFFAVMDKWLEADIKGPSINNGSYGSLSGGEARGIDLALQFGLLDIARIQANRWPDILVMDEILDSSVDGSSIEKLMNIIKVKQADDKSKIFIISHRDIGIGENFIADNIYNVIKENGFSRVEI